MSSVLRRPTLVVGIGPFGRGVLDRLDEDVGALDPGDRARFVTMRLPAPGEPDASATTVSGFRDALVEHLQRLLRAGAEHTQELDLAVLGDITEIGGDLLAGVAHAISGVLESRFGVLFPPALPPEQRNVWLNVILAGPAITASEGGRVALRACMQLEQWHRGTPGPPSPCLCRIWLAPRQTAGGVLTDEDAQRSVFLFAAAAYLSGLRDTEQLRARLGASRSGRVLATFAVAAADVPVGRLIDYCAWRTALAGLDMLAAAADARRPSAVAVDEAISMLQVDGWLSPLEDGAEALALRQRALSPSSQHRSRVSEQPPPGLAESGAAVLWRHAELLEDQLVGPPPAPVDGDPLLQGVDHAETLLVDSALKQADDFVAARLTPENGLRELALVTQSLGRMADLMEKTVGAPRKDSLAASQAAVAQAPRVAAAALRTAAARKQAALPVAFAALPLALLLAVAGAALFAAAGSPVIGDPAMKVLGPGLVAGLAIGALWTLGTLLVAQRAVRRAIADRGAEIAAAAADRTPGGPTRHAEVSLGVRRLRIARTLARALRARQARVQAVRDSLEAARERARTELRGLRVIPGPQVHDDDTRDLLPKQTPFHWPLFLPAVVPDICLKTGPQDATLWPTRVLIAAWPKDALLTDLPFADVRLWFNLAHEQHETLRSQSPFNWPDVGSSLEGRVTSFLQAVPRTLSFGLRSLRENGDRESSSDETELLVLAPADAGTVLTQAQRGPGVPALTECRTLSASPRVVALRTATEIDTAGAWRGLQ